LQSNPGSDRKRLKIQTGTETETATVRQLTKLCTKIASASLLEMDITSTVPPSRSLEYREPLTWLTIHIGQTKHLGIRNTKAELLEYHVLALPSLALTPTIRSDKAKSRNILSFATPQEPQNSA
jgi:hypothetical protein